MGILSNAERLERARELKQSVEGNYEHTANIQDYELVEWLIEQAEENAKLRQALDDILHVDGCSYVEDKEDIFAIAAKALEETK